MNEIKAIVTYEEVNCGNCKHTLGTIDNLEEFCKEKGSECYNLKNEECYLINKYCEQCGKVNVVEFTAYIELSIRIKASTLYCIEYKYLENFFKVKWLCAGLPVNIPHFKKENLISKNQAKTLTNMYIDNINRFTIENEGKENCTIMLNNEE